MTARKKQKSSSASEDVDSCTQSLIEACVGLGRKHRNAGGKGSLWGNLQFPPQRQIGS